MQEGEVGWGGMDFLCPHVEPTVVVYVCMQGYIQYTVFSNVLCLQLTVGVKGLSRSVKRAKQVSIQELLSNDFNVDYLSITQLLQV